MAGFSWLLRGQPLAQNSEGQFPVLRDLFFAKIALLCDPKVPVKWRIHAFYSTCVAAVLNGAGKWAYTRSMFQALRIWDLGKLRCVLCLRRRTNETWVDHMKRTGPVVAEETWQTSCSNACDATSPVGCLADDTLPR